MCIRDRADFAQHHLPGALPTYAYPAKSEAERSKLLPTVRQILAGKDDVVIVCPAGGGGARNTYEFLKSQGVPESRMRILEKGQKGWPYAEMVTRDVYKRQEPGSVAAGDEDFRAGFDEALGAG